VVTPQKTGKNAGMDTHAAEQPDLLATLRQLSLAEIDQRLADLDAVRAALSLLRRSLAARDRAKRRRQHVALREGSDAT
jgi:hypothetical protein